MASIANSYDRPIVDDRREPRFAIRVPGALLTYRRRDEIVVENVSRSGALVSGVQVPEKGTEVVLDAGVLQIVATVAWSGDRACGLSFHRAIEPGVLRRLRAA